MELIIVRHGRPEHVEDVAGAADPDLADVGHRQAERVGEYLAPMGVDVVVTSPLARARQTAAPLARMLGLEPIVVDGVAEYDRHDSSYVPAEVTRQLIRDGATDETWEDPLSVLGEDEKRRWMTGVHDAFASIVAENPGRRVAVFCHGMVTSVWFAQMLGIDDTLRFVPDYAGVTRVLASASNDSVTVRSFNETHFLGDSHIPLFEK
ncbi:MAG: histidine phosphatase family protein [Acidimicrobiales bacterium]|nr:histidine phosphatase family protein [Acidimicrobiales bacterium]